MKKILLLAYLAINGCAYFNANNPDKPPIVMRTQSAITLKQWQAQGSLAARSINTKGVNASFVWQQNKQNYHLFFIGPFGSYPLWVQGTEQQMTIRTQKGFYTTKNPKLLLYGNIPIDIPVKQLTYWLRGLPEPHQPYHSIIDNRGYLRQLQQDDWTIDYTSYTQSGNKILPQRMKIHNKRWTLNLVITRWKVVPDHQ